MLDDLAPHLTAVKASDLLARIEGETTKHALAAEFELGLLWAISQVADLTVEFEMTHSRSRPDAYSKQLFGRAGPALIEITALSDEAFSGEKSMERAANIICQFANRVKKGSGKNLYFVFDEAQGYKKGRYFRSSRISDKFSLTPALEQLLSDWLVKQKVLQAESIRLEDEHIGVTVHFRDRVSRFDRTFTSVVPAAYDVERNPLFSALDRKKDQLSDAGESVLKCIFVCDAGSYILRNLEPLGGREVGGRNVILHFLKKSSIDVVCVFSPYRSWQLFQNGVPSAEWKVTPFTRATIPSRADFALVEKLVGLMPKPRLEGYQARSRHKQGRFSPQGSGIYGGCSVTYKGGKRVIKISSRLVLEYLAGRVDADYFKATAFGKHENQFEKFFSQGLTTQTISFEKGGLDRDDDYLVFELEQDVAAAPLRNPKSESR